MCTCSREILQQGPRANLSHRVSQNTVTSTSQSGTLINNITAVKSTYITYPGFSRRTPQHAWSILNEQSKHQVDEIIERYRCKNNLNNAAQVWDEKHNTLSALGITPPMFAYRAEVTNHSFWRAVTNIEIERDVQNVSLSNRQTTLLEKIIPRSAFAIPHLEAAKIWQINANNLLLEGISRQMFANRCGIKFDCFRTANWQCEKFEPTPINLLKSQRLVEKKINLDNMVLKRKKMGGNWRIKEYQRRNYDQAVTVLLASKTPTIAVCQDNAPPKTYQQEVTYSECKEAWESTNPYNQSITEHLINQQKCLKNTRLSARVWVLYSENLQAQGINDKAFSYKCGVPYLHFTRVVNNLLTLASLP